MASRVEQFDTLVRQQPTNALFRFSLAQALLAEGRAAESIPHLELCVASRADWMMPRIMLGRVYLGIDRKAEARAMLTDALELAVAQHHEDPERELRSLLAEF